MLRYDAGFFEPDRYAPEVEWPANAWWPPMIRMLSNIGWYSSLTTVWPGIQTAEDREVKTREILGAIREPLQNSLIDLIERMINPNGNWREDLAKPCGAR